MYINIHTPQNLSRHKIPLTFSSKSEVDTSDDSDLPLIAGSKKGARDKKLQKIPGARHSRKINLR